MINSMHSGYDPTIYPPRLTSWFFLINNDFSVKITIFGLEMKKGHLWYILYKKIPCYPF